MTWKTKDGTILVPEMPEELIEVFKEQCPEEFEKVFEKI
tara:strand:+ start:358 stop:474 length:117 start_codon:yes stop_codon:yes gene_type:complete